MKISMLSLFVLCAVANANRGLQSDLGAGASQLSVETVSAFTYHVAKRQTTNDLTQQDILDCSSALIEYQCGTSGYAQRHVDIALGCRNNTYARNIANTCARSENGELCGTATLRFVSDETESANAATCAGAVTSGSCPSGCRSFLQSWRSKFGCCINTYVNTTDNPLYQLYREYVDYRLWNLCNVDIPAADCGNGLPLNPPANAQTCTSQQFFSRFIDYKCMASVGQPFVDAVLQNRRCYLYARLMMDGCASNANGQFCAEAIGLDLLESVTTDSLLVSLTSNCFSTSSCSSSCRNAITNVDNAYGCCVNIYNNSAIGLQLPSLSYSVWNSCGIDSPGFCTSTLSASPTMKGISWIIVAIIAMVLSIKG